MWYVLLCANVLLYVRKLKKEGIKIMNRLLHIDVQQINLAGKNSIGDANAVYRSVGSGQGCEGHAIQQAVMNRTVTLITPLCHFISLKKVNDFQTDPGLFECIT